MKYSIKTAASTFQEEPVDEGLEAIITLKGVEFISIENKVKIDQAIDQFNSFFKKNKMDHIDTEHALYENYICILNEYNNNGKRNQSEFINNKMLVPIFLKCFENKGFECEDFLKKYEASFRLDYKYISLKSKRNIMKEYFPDWDFSIDHNQIKFSELLTPSDKVIELMDDETFTIFSSLYEKPDLENEVTNRL